MRNRNKRSVSTYTQRLNSRNSFSWYMKLPKDIKFYKADDDVHDIIIVPYVIKTEDHPLVKKRKAKVGDLDYVLDLEVHQNVGPEEKSVICPKRNFNMECPICEEYDAASEESREGFKTSRRVIYNIVDVNKPEKGLQLLAVSHWLFEKELLDEAKAISKADEFLDFASIGEGYVISFRGTKDSFKNNSFTKYKSFKFEVRDQGLVEMYDKERWDEKSLSLDEFMVLYTYDEIKDILYGVESNDEPEEKNERKEVSRNEEKEVDDREERRRRRREREEKEEKEDNIKCPHGLKFGIDTDKEKVCDSCDIWDKCDVECAKLEKEMNR